MLKQFFSDDQPEPLDPQDIEDTKHHLTHLTMKTQEKFCPVYVQNEKQEKLLLNLNLDQPLAPVFHNLDLAADPKLDTASQLFSEKILSKNEVSNWSSFRMFGSVLGLGGSDKIKEMGLIGDKSYIFIGDIKKYGGQTPNP